MLQVRHHRYIVATYVNITYNIGKSACLMYTCPKVCGYNIQRLVRIYQAKHAWPFYIRSLFILLAAAIIICY